MGKKPNPFYLERTFRNSPGKMGILPYSDGKNEDSQITWADLDTLSVQTKQQI